MEDKAFELLEKMYGEFTEFRKESNTRLDKVEGSIKTLGNQVTSLEHGLKKDISVLYDGYKQTYEKLEVIEDKVDTLSEKVDKHDIKIQVIEGGQK